MLLVLPTTKAALLNGHEYKLKTLLTPTESKFYDCLESVSAGRCRIQIKPRLADVFLHVVGGSAAFNRISQKHVDFLLCDVKDWTPMLGVELDDDSHKNPETAARDEFVNELFACAGLPLLRVNVQEHYSLEQLVQHLTAGWKHRWLALKAAGQELPTNQMG